ncbi:hypothetical protein SEA_VROOMVROOM_25 [Arthrobacter phage VroomVroom]|uniref:Uncharacterized protein n=1 Tax=Arthrobacter phage VroomVroom TaxID=3049371 RepID=A0AA49IV25_9CAUD|nr:hypothetical protein SEA_VROOMVROOM_25 [Arthrobacter phage VroomVroom]
MEHRTATISRQELDMEIAKAFALGEDGPRFCNEKYVGLAACERIGGHKGEHAVTGNTGRIIGWGEPEVEIALYVTRPGGWHGGYRVIFQGPQADAMAAEYIKTRPGHFDLDYEDWEPAEIPLTMEALDPTCEHGLSSRLCAGPGHYSDH